MEKGENVKSIQSVTLSVLYWIVRILAVALLIFMFLSELNPSRITTEINSRVSLFTSAVSYNKLVYLLAAPLRLGYVESSTFVILQIASLAVVFGIVCVCVSAALSFGNGRSKQIGGYFLPAGGALMLLGLLGIYMMYDRIENPSTDMSIEAVKEMVPPNFASSYWLYFSTAIFAIVLFVVIQSFDRFKKNREKFVFGENYKLFLYAFPIILLTFIFSYLPLKGFSQAFYETSTFGDDIFVGGKWFRYLFENKEAASRLLQVLRNTLIMSGLGLITSWIPVAFAVFFSEIKDGPVRKIIQTVTTLPNFISWILIYALAIALFSTNGFLNNILSSITGREFTRNWLEVKSTVWLQMLAWGIWKGTGWSAIIYIAAITGIDRGLYEAAEIDGAKRFAKMRYITIPMLIPTFSVMLLLSFANMLTNGLDQYLVFSNATNMDYIEVLDLYVYNLGFTRSGSLDASKPLATVISMAKTLVSLLLLFIANQTSKSIRGESII